MRLFRKLLAASCAVCFSVTCSTGNDATIAGPTSTKIPSVAELARQLIPNDRIGATVLVSPAPTLDSLYTAKYGVRGVLPLTEDQVQSAINSALEATDISTEALAAARASRDLNLTADQVKANADVIRQLYANWAAYKVYSNLPTKSTASPQTVSAAYNDTFFGANPLELWLLANNPLLYPPFRRARNDAVSLETQYNNNIPEQTNDTRENAFRHAMWNMLIVSYSGPYFTNVADDVAWAKRITDAHESDGPDEGSIASSMDLHNNGVGRALIEPLAYRDFNWTYFVVTPDNSFLYTLLKAKADKGFLVTSATEMEQHPNDLVFIRARLTVSTAGSGSGIVSSAGGSISCSGKNPSADKCTTGVLAPSVATLTAVASPGSVFAGWSGGCSRTTSSCEITMNQDKTVTATFNVQQTYLVSLLSSPTDGGTTAGGGSYVAGSSASVSANAGTGFTFSRWTENGQSISTDNPYAFTVTASRSLTANFTSNTPQRYSISTLSSPANGGTTTGGGTFTSGTQASVSASPATGFTFSQWNDGSGFVSTENPYRFTVNANRSFVAVFAASSNKAPSISITSPANNTTVDSGATIMFFATATDPEDGTLSGGSVVWSSSLMGQFGTGTSFATPAKTVGTHTVTATATDSHGLSTSAQITLIIRRPANNPPSIRITSPADGTVVDSGATVTFSANASDPEDGPLSGNAVTWSSSLVGFFGTGTLFDKVAQTIGTHTITATANDAKGLSTSSSVTLTIRRRTSTTYSLALGGAGTGNGSVSSNPSGINCTVTAGATSGTCAHDFSSGTSVTLTPTAAASYAFVGWLGACSGTGPCQVAMDQARSVTASFSAPTTCTSSASVSSQTFPSGQHLNPKASFTMSWTLSNTGTCKWTSAYRLMYFNGPSSQSHTMIAVNPTVAPGGTFQFSVPMQMPSAAGTYVDNWLFVDSLTNAIQVSGSPIQGVQLNAVIDAPHVNSVTDITHSSVNQPITISGSSFSPDATVTVWYPSGPADGVTLVGTQVQFLDNQTIKALILTNNATGQWSARVNNAPGPMSQSNVVNFQVR